MQEISLTRPDDWHVHLRDGAALSASVPHSARYFGRSIIMPNLAPPVVTTDDALQYRQRILAHVRPDQGFNPLMALYLTDLSSPDEIVKAKASGHVYAAKLYPAGATTNSSHGVTKLEQIYPCLEKMSELGMPLLIHGEVTTHDVDIFDREKAFIDTVLSPLSQRFPDLNIVLEHITTRQAVEFVEAGSSNIAATVTAHHLMYNRNHMLAGGIRPHYYCLPILKRNEHQQALLKAVSSGSPKFFLGTDSAPHAKEAKENVCGCAGCFSTHAAIELYAEVFDALNALDKLEGFASFYGPDFYGLPRNTDKITLRKAAWEVPSTYDFGEQQVVPLKANEQIQWSVIDV